MVACFNMPKAARTNVDLPDPLSPTMAKTSPLGTEKDTSRTASSAPYEIVTLSNTIQSDLFNSRILC